jgi:ATP phosphoribosyltransferase
MIRLGLPKGRMAPDASRFCMAMGVELRAGVLSYRAAVAGAEVAIYLLKAPDVASFLMRNQLDLGLAGDEWLMETGIPLERRCFEVRSYVATLGLLMAFSDSRSVDELRSVATPYPRLARRLAREAAPLAAVMPVAGSTEAVVPDIADACLDVVETGRSAALNGLAVRRSFDEVTTHLVRSERCDLAAATPVVELLAGAMEFAR